MVREAIEAHGRYLKGLPKGRRAVLQYVNLNNYELDGVDLSEADLTGAIFERAGQAVMAKIMSNDKAAAALSQTGPGRVAIPLVNAPDLQKAGKKKG